METPQKDNGIVPETVENESKPGPTISRERWVSRRTHPRLVNFSWGAVSPMNSQRR